VNYLKALVLVTLFLLLGPPRAKCQTLSLVTDDAGTSSSEADASQTPSEVTKTTTTGTPSPSNTSSQLKDLGFGVALGLQWNVLKPPIINDATIDGNGFVRVNTRANTSPSLMLESHYLVKKFGKLSDKGLGPFVAVQPGGNNQVISSVGAGILFDWKINPGITTTTTEGDKTTKTTVKTADTAKRTGFGLGFGYASIPSAKTLGDEFVPNAKAPIGPDGKPLPIRFETRDKGSIMMILSFTF